MLRSGAFYVPRKQNTKTKKKIKMSWVSRLQTSVEECKALPKPGYWPKERHVTEIYPLGYCRYIGLLHRPFRTKTLVVLLRQEYMTRLYLPKLSHTYLCVYMYLCVLPCVWRGVFCTFAWRSKSIPGGAQGYSNACCNVQRCWLPGMPSES